ncbi:MAG: NADPH:quinone reductase [Alphaproteobacteria bacterium]
MRAAYYEKNGPAKEVLHLGDVATPEPKAGEVRVRLHSSGVNPSDVKNRAGTTRKIAFPRVVPHSDGAGEIDKVGDGVAKSRIGERVWIWNGQWKRPEGTAAQYIVLPEQQAVRLPAKTSFEAGACLGIPALTAWHAIWLAGAAPGQTILIPGGAGAVGHYAIQFAKAGRAKVITTVSSKAKADLARAAGADHVIDYKTENVADRVAEITDKQRVDSIIEVDLSANAPLIPLVLKQKGKVVVYGTGPVAQISSTFCLTHSIQMLFMLVYELSAEERARSVAAVNSMLEQGTLINNVALTLPLDQMVAAHETVEQGKALGNVVITL